LIGGGLFVLGLIIGLRFLYFLWIGQGGGHVQSLILAALLIAVGVQALLAAFLADLIGVNRSLLEQLRYGVGELRDARDGESKR